MGNPGSGFISPDALSDSTNAGVSPTIDTSAASATTHVNPSFGDKLGSAISQHYQGRPVGGLFNQVFGDGQSQAQAPLPTGTGPPIVGIPDGSVAEAPQAHSSGLIKALIQAFI